MHKKLHAQCCVILPLCAQFYIEYFSNSGYAIG